MSDTSDIDEVIEEIVEKSDNDNDTGNVTDVNIVKTTAPPVNSIEQFSCQLADSLVKEAIVINQIYDRDKVNNANENDEINKNTNADVLGMNNELSNQIKDATEANGTYDRYLLDKLLHSEADPAEVEGCNGFDGIEEHFNRSADDTGQDGVDADDKDNVARTDSECDVNDQNNNMLTTAEDGTLQTIHEDSVLEIDTCRSDAKTDDRDVRAVDVSKSVENENNVGGVNGVHNVSEEALRNEMDTVFPSLHSDDGELTDSQESVGEEEDSDDSTDEEELCCEMTLKQKQKVVKAVRDGSINKVERLLEKRYADLNMLWYGETLLMVAIRSTQEKMAEFLIDNEIDIVHEANLVDVDADGTINSFTTTARQMALEAGMEDLVEVLDVYSNNLFHFIKPRQRVIRKRRPRPPTPPTPPEVFSDDDVSYDYDAEDDICILRRFRPKEGEELPEESTEQSPSRTRRRSRRNTNRDIDADDKTNMTDRSMEEKSKRTKSSAFTDYESVHSHVESVHSKTSKSSKISNVSKAESNEDITRVFGQDEGYETMSPISPLLPPVPKFEQNIVGTKDHVNVRGTKASHMMKTYNNANKQRIYNSEKNDVYIYSKPNTNMVGSYSFESKRWKASKSAPVPKNYSMESIPDSIVRVGVPFRHGNERRKPINNENTRFRRSKSQSAGANSLTHRRTDKRMVKSANASFSQVEQILAGSKLLSNSLNYLGYSSSYFPTINDNKKHFVTSNYPTKTRINSIYANRCSTAPHERITFI